MANGVFFINTASLEFRLLRDCIESSRLGYDSGQGQACPITQFDHGYSFINVDPVWLCLSSNRAIGSSPFYNLSNIDLCFKINRIAAAFW